MSYIWKVGCLLSLFAILGACGVNQQVHESVLQDSFALKEDLGLAQEALSESRERADSAEALIQILEEQLKDLESELEARMVELQSLRQQNLELLNMRDNQLSEMEELQVQVGRQLAKKMRLKAEIDRQLLQIDELQGEMGRIQAAEEKKAYALKQIYDRLVGELREEIAAGEIKVTQVLDRLSISMAEQVLFDSGSAKIKPLGQKVLKRLGEILKSVKDKQIRVEGHTDNVSIGSALVRQFPSNWELSSIRAIHVVKLLVEEGGVDPLFLSGSGYSMYRPMVSNETKEGRAKNRRIEIKLLPFQSDQVLENSP